MQRRLFLSLFSAASLAPLGAHALTMQAVHPRLAAPGDEDGIGWDLLAQAGGVHLVDGRLSRFPAAVNELAARDSVQLIGYMYPFSESGPHDRFLLSAYAYHCAACMAGEPSRLVLVEAAEPVGFTAGPVALTGKLVLVEDAEARLFYRLTAAAIA
jgi:hypothetical protein